MGEFEPTQKAKQEIRQSIQNMFVNDSENDGITLE